MRPRGLILLLVALISGAGVGVLPGLASGSLPMSASFTAQDFSWNVSGSSANSVTVAMGATVSFDYPSGHSKHNAAFSNAPSSCSEGTPVMASTGAAVPASPTPPAWSGSCTFNTPGVYTFHCDLHNSMSGTINVADASGTVPGTTTTSTTPPGTTTGGSPGSTTTAGTPTSTTGQPGGPTSTTGGGGLLGGQTERGAAGGGSGGPLASISVAHAQRGGKVKGIVHVALAGSLVQVDLLAPSASLAKAKSKRGSVRVGHFQRAANPAGSVSFAAVALNTRARRTLKRRHRLAVSVVVTVTPPGRAAQRLTSAASVRP